MIEKAQLYQARIIHEVKLDYLLTLPDGYSKAGAAAWPLILFLHGAGERGDDLNMVRIHGIPKEAAQTEPFPFITLSPLCPADHWWGDYMEALIGLVEATITAYHVNPQRVYLTGLSMGGYGTWHLASAYPERFAAAAPICGGGFWMYGFPERVAAMKEVPVWAFHGGKDPVVNIEQTQIMVDALEAAGGDVTFTIYPDADHDAWTQTYSNPALYEWFLSHTLAGRDEGA